MKGKTIFTFFIMLLSITIYSQHTDDHKTHNEDQHHHEEHSDHHGHKHHLSLLVGGGTNFDHHETKPGLGLDYEFRISDIIGIGGVAEVEFTNKPSFLVSVPLFFHPVKGLKIYGGPAVTSSVEHLATEEDSHDPHAETHDPERKMYFAGRIGSAYDLTLGKITFGPTVNLVFGHTTALIYGINIGIGF